MKLQKSIRQIVDDTIMKEIDKQLPAITTDIIIKSIKSNPDRQLSDAGFGWALAIALQEHWPDLDRMTAVRWLREYVEVPTGTTGYDWSYSAAKSLAAQYVAEFGELA